jgi:hypothetical protein
MPAPVELTGQPSDPLRNLPNPRSYDTGDKDVVGDNVTRLTWQKAVPGETFTFAEAERHCADLDLGGRSDWRLPARIELVSLVDFTGSRVGNVDDVAFPDAPAAPMWSCSDGPANPLIGWIVDFLHGNAGTADKAARHLVRCVAGATTFTPPPGRYVREGPDEVRDADTGLIWKTGASPNGLTWGGAYDFCRSLGAAWRIPSAPELQTLIDERHVEAAVERSTFDNPDDFYWTSSLFDGNGSIAWFVSIGEGNTYWLAGDQIHQVRCVR